MIFIISQELLIGFIAETMAISTHLQNLPPSTENWCDICLLHVRDLLVVSVYIPVFFSCKRLLHLSLFHKNRSYYDSTAYKFCLGASQDGMMIKQQNEYCLRIERTTPIKSRLCFTWDVIFSS